MKNQLKYAHGKWTFNFLTTMSYPLLLIKIRQIFKNCFNEFYNGRVTRLLKGVVLLEDGVEDAAEHVNAVVQDDEVLDGGHGEVERVSYAQGEGSADAHYAQQAADQNVHDQSAHNPHPQN